MTKQDTKMRNIEKLIKQATVKVEDQTYGWKMEFDKEKFAELLLKDVTDFLWEVDPDFNVYSLRMVNQRYGIK